MYFVFFFSRSPLENNVLLKFKHIAQKTTVRDLREGGIKECAGWGINEMGF